MIYRRFEFIIVVRIIFIVLTSLLFTYTIDREGLFVTKISIVIIWCAQVWWLLHYINRTNRELAKFFLAFKYKDSTMVFNNETKSSSFDNLYRSFNHIIEAFSEVKIDKESDYLYYNSLIEHVNIGILTFDHKNNVKTSNSALLKLLNIKTITSIDKIKEISNDLYETITTIEYGKQKLIKIIVGDEIKQLAINANEIYFEKGTIKIISLKDIKNELEQNEVESWQKLIRIFTHEIANSISPVSLISSGLLNQYENKNIQVDDDTILGLQTINSRSKGLLNYINRYKNLTHIPIPEFSDFNSRETLEHIEAIFKNECKDKNILFRISDSNILINGDCNLISMVLINLVKNSISATDETKKPIITIESNSNSKNTTITITDNGKGISSELIDNIFTPFFTTREEGSGIGLSLARQIMKLHNGSISVSSKPEIKTTFTLTF